jgi:hypothetical protein
MRHQPIVLGLAAAIVLASVGCQNSPGRPRRYSKVIPPDQVEDLQFLCAELRGMPWAWRQPGSGHSSCRPRLPRDC